MGRTDDLDNTKAVATKEKGEDVDSVWGWVTVFGSFWCNFVFMGFASTTGMFFVVFLEVFQGSFAMTALVNSLNFGCLHLAGPLGSWLLSKFGERRTVIGGTILSSLGLLCSSLATNLYTLYITLGVMTGIGLGTAHLACCVAPAEKFDKHRAKAISLVFAGSSFGITFYPWITKPLLEAFGWRGALLLCSGINLNGCVFAMLIKTSNFKKVKTDGNILSNWQSLYSKAFSFCNTGCVLILINCTLFSFGIIVVLTHVVKYVEILGYSSYHRSLVLTLFGVSGLTGRLCLAALGNRFDALKLFFATYFISGIAVIVIGLSKSITLILISVAVFGGLGGAASGPLIAECMCIVVGVEHYNYAFGYCFVVTGIGLSLGAPFAGYLYDITGIYQYSFYFGGIVTIVSALVITPIKIFDLTARPNKASEDIPAKVSIDIVRL